MSKSPQLAVEREVAEALGVSGKSFKTPCVVHDDGSCLKIGKIVHHHLDEAGSSGPSSWFVENIVPICEGLNGTIQRARRQHLREELITQHDLLSADALGALYKRYQTQGQLLRAYAAARIGAFLTASPRNRLDPRAALNFATSCLWSLRGVKPKFGIPFATDTLARSVFKHLGPLRPDQNGDLKVMLNLAGAVGSFHRDFGDREPAADYYRLALEVADLARLDWSDDDLPRLVRNIRVLLGGSFETAASNELRDLMRGETGYPATLHERSHVQQWDYRQQATGTWRQRRQAAEEFLAGNKNLERLYLDRRRSLPGAFDNAKAEMKAAVMFSEWDRSEIVCLIGDAYAALACGGPHSAYAEHAYNAMRFASEFAKEGHFAVASLAKPMVFDFLRSTRPGDEAFTFEFRGPAMLWQKCRSLQFGSLSAVLIDNMRRWVGARRPATSPVIQGIQTVLAKSSMLV